MLAADRRDDLPLALELDAQALGGTVEVHRAHEPGAKRGAAQLLLVLDELDVFRPHDRHDLLIAALIAARRAQARATGDEAPPEPQTRRSALAQEQIRRPE